jgi:FmdE, Molybdenum formylmethanofuran dehydrogenase operon
MCFDRPFVKDVMIRNSREEKSSTMLARRLSAAAVLLVMLSTAAPAETPEEWIALGARVHGGFGSFIPLGIKIGLDALERLKVKPREVAVVYFDGAQAPCACFADGIAIATQASVGQ